MSKRKANSIEDSAPKKKLRKLEGCSKTCVRQACPDPKLCTKCKQYYGTEFQKWLCSRCYVCQHGMPSYLQYSSYFRSLHSSRQRQAHEMQKYVKGLKTYTPLVEVAIDLIAGYALDPFEFYQVSEVRVKRQRILNRLMLDNADAMKQTVKKALKFAIDKNHFISFADLLVHFQPWMSIKDALEILSTLNVKATDKQNGHKAIGLLHFVCDGGLDDGVHLKKLVSFCTNNGAGATICYRFNGSDKCCDAVYWCGFHMMRGHPLNFVFPQPVTRELLLHNMQQSYKN